MFARAWLFVGHESQIPKPGDYLRLVDGRGVGDPVPRPRRTDPRLPQLVPASRHEGVPLRRGQHGRVPAARTTAGATAPTARWSACRSPDAYGAQLDRSQWGLVEVARIENYKGTIWATWDPAAPPFSEYLGGYKLYLDLLLDSLGRPRRRHRGHRRHPQVAHPLQLEVPGRELLGRSLSRRQPPLGGHGRHRPERQGPPRHAGAATRRAGSTSRFPSSATR